MSASKKNNRNVYSLRATPSPTIRQIGTTLADELGAIVDELGEDHPDLLRHIVRYIQRLDESHPTWGPVLDRARDRQLRRQDARHQNKR